MPEAPTDLLPPDPRLGHHPWWRLYGVFLVLLQIYLWSGFLIQTARLPAPTSDVIPYSFAILNGIGMVAWSFASQRRIWVTAFWVLFTFSQLVVNFSYLYWSHGSAADFTMPLSHLDAIYFTVGTLSTSGTGDIAAINETTRGIQALQNVLDLGLVLFAISLFVSRASVALGRQPT